jgi:hypothetical protein
MTMTPNNWRRLALTVAAGHTTRRLLAPHTGEGIEPADAVAADGTEAEPDRAELDDVTAN